MRGAGGRGAGAAGAGAGAGAGEAGAGAGAGAGMGRRRSRRRRSRSRRLGRRKGRLLSYYVPIKNSASVPILHVVIVTAILHVVFARVGFYRFIFSVHAL